MTKLPIYQRLSSRILQRITIGLIHLCFRPKVVYASEKAKREAFREPQVIIYNHIRGMDAAVIYSLMRTPAIALAAQDLIDDYPILRWLFDIFPMHRIDREHASLSWLRDSRAFIRNGNHILIAPEGKCCKEKIIQEFKPGCVMLAAASGTKILPIYHNGEYNYVFGKRFKMIVGEPIEVAPPPDGLQHDVMELEASQLRQAVQALEKQLNGIIRTKVGIL